MDETSLNFNFLSWNSRGLNNPTNQEEVKQMISLVRLDLVCLQETKLENITTTTIRNVLGPEFGSDFVFLPAIGTRGDSYCCERFLFWPTSTYNGCKFYHCYNLRLKKEFLLGANRSVWPIK
jgi:hypothetical protein